MTRRSRNRIAEVAGRSVARLEAEGRIARTVRMTPQSFRARAPGTVLHRVKQTTEIATREDAARTFADKPWASKARWFCYANGMFVWERPAEVP